MLRLTLHEKWNKALSPEGRAEIIDAYLTRASLEAAGILYFPLKFAFNHQGDLLVTVFIENRSDCTWVMNHSITCRHNGEKIASAEFNDPDFAVEPFSIMPWTFIYNEKQIMKGIEKRSLSTKELKVSDTDEGDYPVTGHR